jgi:hypothetical protein
MKENCTTRGEFMRGAVRAALLAALAGLCAVSSKRRSPEAVCNTPDACRVCLKSNECPIGRKREGRLP